MTSPPTPLEIEWERPDELKPDPLNARHHSKAQIRQIAASIACFGLNVPILIDGDNKIVAGHGRLAACEALGYDCVPVIRLAHLTPAQARAFAIADNRLVETSTWDEQLLGQILADLSVQDLDFSIEATGFTIGEIDLKIEGLSPTGAEDDPDDDPVPSGPDVARLGDLWTLDRHQVLCGNALEPGSYERLMGDDRAAMVFTDPPYNVPIDGNVSGLSAEAKVHHREFAMAAGEMSEAEFITFLTAACYLMAQVSIDGAIHYICMDWGHILALLTAGRTTYAGLINICVWAKPNGRMGGLYRSAHEMVAVFKNGRASYRNNVQLGRYGRNRTNVWSYSGSNSFGRGEEANLTAQHPTPKPVTMIADAILDVTARGDVVLDPFLGSGSTLMAAERVGRVCRGMELDPRYVDLTIRRWQRLTGDDARREDGVTFDALACEAVQ